MQQGRGPRVALFLRAAAGGVHHASRVILGASCATLRGPTDAGTNPGVAAPRRMRGVGGCWGLLRAYTAEAFLVKTQLGLGAVGRPSPCLLALCYWVGESECRGFVVTHCCVAPVCMPCAVCSNSWRPCGARCPAHMPCAVQYTGRALQPVFGGWLCQ